MQKSSPRKQNFRPGSRSHAERLASFRKQMADDYARGEKLVYLRKKKRLTQAAAAFKAGFSEKSIRAWEKDGPIKWINAKKYAKFYGVDPESIVTRDLRPPVEPEDIEQMREQLADLLERVPATAAGDAAKKGLPESPAQPKRKRRKGS